jgi:ABC-type multidrug transport system ATPase subunit
MSTSNAETLSSKTESGDGARESSGPKSRSKKARADESVSTAVRLTEVTKRFGPKVAVDRVSLRIETGTVYGLIGPNGAGKTTTFSMMAGFLRPTEGSLEVLGHAPAKVGQLKGRLGVLPQDALLPASDTVGDFLLHMARLQNLPANKATAAARSVLEEVDGKDWWKLRCGSLSHGMSKRVALAQALLGDPEVILLDEPTAGLDPKVAYEVRQIIKGRKGRATLVVSSHNLQELEEICDAAVILDRGKVIAAGSISELTAAAEEVHIFLAPGSIVPLPVVRDLPMVTRVEWDEDRRDLGVFFDRSKVDAETVIGHVLWALLNQQARISGVTKGRSLEARVMDLT